MGSPLIWWIWVIFPTCASYSPYKTDPIPISTQKGVRVVCNNELTLPPATYDYMAIQIKCNYNLHEKDANHTADTFKIYSSQRLYVNDISSFKPGESLHAVGMRVILWINLWCPNELLKKMPVYVNVRFKALPFMCDYCVHNQCGVFKENGYYMNADTLYEVKYPKGPDKTVFHIVEIVHPKDVDEQIAYTTRVISTRVHLGTDVNFFFGPGDEHSEVPESSVVFTTASYAERKDVPQSCVLFTAASYIFFGVGVFVLVVVGGVLCCFCLRRRWKRQRRPEISNAYKGGSNSQRRNSVGDSSVPPVPSMSWHPSNCTPARHKSVSGTTVQHTRQEENCYDEIRVSIYEPMKLVPSPEYLVPKPEYTYEPMEVAGEHGKDYLNVKNGLPLNPPPCSIFKTSNPLQYHRKVSTRNRTQYYYSYLLFPTCTSL